MASGSLTEFLSILLTFIGDNTDDTFIPINENEPVDLNMYFNCSKWIFNGDEVTMPIKISQGGSKSGGSGTYHCDDSNVAIIVGGFDLLLTLDKTTLNFGDEATVSCSAKFWSTFKNMQSSLTLADGTFQVLDQKSYSDTSDSDALFITSKDTPETGPGSYLCTWRLSTSIGDAQYSREFEKSQAFEVLEATDPPITDSPITDPPITDPPITDPPITKPPITKPPVIAPSVRSIPATEGTNDKATQKKAEVSTKSEVGGAGDETRRHSDGTLMIALFLSCFNLAIK